MKTTFKSSEIAHIWANRSAPWGKCPGNASFNGAAFLSYGTELARHITHAGKAAIIYNETSYSVSTSIVQGRLRQAIPAGVPLFKISGRGRGDSLFNIGGKELFTYAIERAVFFSGKIPKARNKDQYAAEQANWLTEAQKVNEFFGLRRKVDSDAIKRLAASKARAEKAARIAQEKRERLEREEMATGYANWKEGLNEPYFRATLFPVAFRVEGEELVSTLGARVPMAAARVALYFVLRHKGTTWHRNEETCPVGHYQLDAINEHGIVAGCHRIAWNEVERLAPVLS